MVSLFDKNFCISQLILEENRKTFPNGKISMGMHENYTQKLPLVIFECTIKMISIETNILPGLILKEFNTY